MGKSYNNFITLEQFFTGNHPLLEKAYSAMTIRFFVLSAHYRGTVDFSNEALQAAEKGLEKLMNAISDLERIQSSDKCDAEREEAFGKVVDMVLDLRAKAKADKDWATSDKIRDELAAAGFEVKDTKDGVTWRLNK